MATITLTIPANQVNRIQDGICTRFGYNAATDGTKADFVKAYLIRHIKREIAAYEAGIAANTAKIAAELDAETNITIT